MLKKLFLGAGMFSSYYLNQNQSQDCCGIVGVLTNRNSKQRSDKNPKEDEKFQKRQSVEEMLCTGVELLKNRGYDSAGIATFSHDKDIKARLIRYADEVSSENDKNCIERVIDEVLGEAGLAHIGIAHTRWATCGQRVDRNAHPHYEQNQNIFLVHNGIISNHSEIKNKYLPEIKFTSETDTQIIVQFLGKMRRQGKNMVEALRQFQKIAQVGCQWGLVIIDRNNPDSLYTSTNGSPLLVGFSPEQDEIYIASEKIAFQKQADHFFETCPGEVFEFKVNTITDVKKRMIQENRLIKIDKGTEVLKKPPPPFERFYEYEIRQQGTLVFKPQFDRVKKTVKFGDYLTLIACGSSFHAANCAEYFFKKLKCFKKVNFYDPVQLDPHDIAENQTVVLISQSGQTKDLIQIVDECKSKDRVNTIGIINVEGSTLARKVDFPIYIKVGREVSVAATKSFFYQVINVIQFATEVAQQKQTASMQVINEIREQLLRVPEISKQVIKQVDPICRDLAQILYKKESLYLLGKRQTIGVARQTALKIKELNYIHAEALGACEMKHGPIALIDSDKKDNKEKTVVIIFVLDNETYPICMNAVDQMHSRNAYVILVTNCPNRIEQSYIEESKKTGKQIERKYKYMITVPYAKHTSHIFCILPMQILVEHICRLKGINPDMPRNLAKTVTV